MQFSMFALASSAFAAGLSRSVLRSFFILPHRRSFVKHFFQVFSTSALAERAVLFAFALCDSLFRLPDFSVIVKCFFSFLFLLFYNSVSALLRKNGIRFCLGLLQASPVCLFSGDSSRKDMASCFSELSVLHQAACLLYQTFPLLSTLFSNFFRLCIQSFAIL